MWILRQVLDEKIRRNAKIKLKQKKKAAMRAAKDERVFLTRGDRAATGAVQEGGPDEGVRALRMGLSASIHCPSLEIL